MLYCIFLRFINLDSRGVLCCFEIQDLKLKLDATLCIFFVFHSEQKLDFQNVGEERNCFDCSRWVDTRNKRNFTRYGWVNVCYSTNEHDEVLYVDCHSKWKSNVRYCYSLYCFGLINHLTSISGIMSAVSKYPLAMVMNLWTIC